MEKSWARLSAVCKRCCKRFSRYVWYRRTPYHGLGPLTMYLQCACEVEWRDRLWDKISNLSCCAGEQPWTDHNEVLNKCSVSDWKEYVTSMGKFTNLVTEAVHSLDMVC